MRKILLLLFGVIVIAFCSKRSDQVVAWKPEHPKAGEKVTINFRPQRLVKSEQQSLLIFMGYQLVQEQAVKTFRIPMVSKKQFWQATIKTEPGTYLLRLKFEDQLDRVEDNNGWGWNIVIRDGIGNIIRNTGYKLGVIFSQEKRSGFGPDYFKSYDQFKHELSSFPENYQVWFDLWITTLKETNWSKQQLDKITFQLDSILTNSKPSADVLALAYNTQWKVLNDYKSAIKYGEIILSKYENYPKKDEIEYSMIFLKSGGNRDVIDSELLKFIDQSKDPEYLKKAYYQLGISFQQRQIIDESIKYFQSYIELEPHDIQIRLKLANLLIKKQDYELAQQMIDQAQANCVDENYFQTNPWEEPAQRREWLKVDQCQILSTQATLETARQSYQLAIQNRKQVIELGTPFPAFEWVKIGDIYFQSGQLDSAQQAYIKALSINNAQEDAINKLKFIYRLTKGDDVNFYDYLRTEIDKELKASAKFAPDFELVDLEGNMLRLADQKGKVVVLTFWDSWSTACQQEIPQLNALVDEVKNNSLILFWAISVEAPVSINRFINQNPFYYHHFHSGYQIKKLFNVIGFPTHVIIDQSGKIRYTHIGYSPQIQQELKKEIELLLQEVKVTS